MKTLISLLAVFFLTACASTPVETASPAPSVAVPSRAPGTPEPSAFSSAAIEEAIRAVEDYLVITNRFLDTEENFIKQLDDASEAEGRQIIAERVDLTSETIRLLEQLELGLDVEEQKQILIDDLSVMQSVLELFSQSPSIDIASSSDYLSSTINIQRSIQVLDQLLGLPSN